ncbi:hypothetical protein CC78DRAFT_620824 [Lojkania enalia]|uniref:Zn(2)-C6 fungal-type domain-containing protein n=1 Tax=Lojkania enalia TaxID=147567 RepID=A0A9P4K000_9PLEO|nr:hypothetical protein CC78DRAFT_620824 [Didymosphaeria enalia]
MPRNRVVLWILAPSHLPLCPAVIESQLTTTSTAQVHSLRGNPPAETQLPGQRLNKHGRQPKPPKLRSACNQCNAAKVKCSGEREGCTRCVNLRVQCIYVESRVGKVQGIRTKRKRAPTESDTATDVPSRANSIGRAPEDRPDERQRADLCGPSVTSPKRHAPDSLEQALRSWSADSWNSTNWDNEIISLDVPPTIFEDYMNENATATHTTTTALDMLEIGTISDTTSANGSGIAFSSSELSSTISEPAGDSTEHKQYPPLRLTPPPQSAAPSAPALATPVSLVSAPASATLATKEPITPREPSAREIERSMAKIDSKCVLACANIITTLENYLLSELKVLDLILSTVRQVGDELKKLIQHQQQTRSDRCMLLFVTIMHQIIHLLEMGAKETFEEDSTHENVVSVGLFSDTQSCFMPKLGFGAFSINSEEQRAWKSHIIRKELQHTGELLAGILALARLGPRGACNSPEAVAERIKCLSMLERRLKSLGDKAGL